MEQVHNRLLKYRSVYCFAAYTCLERPSQTSAKRLVTCESMLAPSLLDDC